MNKKGGFTLIELLVVIAIIGILSSVVLVSLNSARQKGSDARIQTELNQVRNQLEADFDGAGYPDIQVSGTATVATTTNAAAGAVNLTTVLGDINSLNGGTSKFTSASIPTSGTTWGALILTSTSGAGTKTTDYAIYARTNAGYQCVDSSGRTLTNTSGTWPTYGTDSTSKVQCK
ncbi:MAG TPA: type II secretion system protein [Candidatus Paceibacterota bacterium]|nr:type II secretion system protein [Candidatus Paceibacterota bacterium]